MGETRRRFDRTWEGAVAGGRGKRIAQVRVIGVNEGTLGNWVALDGSARGWRRRAERGRAGGAGAAAREVASCGCGVMCSNAAWLWVSDAMGSR